eukprot:Awhi_evm1s12925
MSTMKAITQNAWGNSSVLEYTTQPRPTLKPKDVLVKNLATGINPIDYKVRQGLDPSAPNPTSIIVGWDGAGIIEEVGSEATGGFKIGDEVYYAGDITRNGSYAQYTAVDSKAVALKPKTISFEEAASLPLVAETAYETFEVDFNLKKGDTILIINGGGGLGSFAVQIAAHMGATVITSASRPETTKFVKELGAHHVINHRNPLAPQLKELGFDGVDYLFHAHDQNLNMAECVKLVNPLGKIAITFGLSPEAISKVDLTDM